MYKFDYRFHLAFLQYINKEGTDRRKKLLLYLTAYFKIRKLSVAFYISNPAYIMTIVNVLIIKRVKS
ncbi:hypothetical protein KIS4809_2926 [Bacillus sp. ZZV12-4809]|nr:hypothetical protein KIS4809_2926 [Bacillus sp. ZZV12-4809]